MERGTSTSSPCLYLQARIHPLLSHMQQPLELKAAQTGRFFPKPALVVFPLFSSPCSPSWSCISTCRSPTRRWLGAAGVTEEGTELGERPEQGQARENACLCASTRRQIVDIKASGRLWDWAISFSPRTKGPFLSRCRTETILKGQWNFWAFSPLGDALARASQRRTK